MQGEVHFDHDLPDELVDRIKKVAAVFVEVMPDPLEKWIHDFGLDLTPEREVGVFEAMATIYERVVRPSDSLQRKKDTFSAVLACSMTPWGLWPLEATKERVWKGASTRS